VPSNTRAPRAAGDLPRYARTLGRARGLALLLGLCVSLAALASPSTASASGGCAPALGKVKAFHGYASLRFATGAVGVDPGEGGFQSIILIHTANSLRIDMKKERVTRKGAEFGGDARLGHVTVADTFVQSATGLGGSQSYSGPLGSHPSNSGYAQLRVDRRRNKCRYEFIASFEVPAAYSGDEEIDQPPSEISGGAYSGTKHLPGDLKLSFSGALPAHLSCVGTVLLVTACYTFRGGWTVDFATLFLCHSVVAVGCADDSKPMGAAEFTWKLSPKFKKKKT
jgi:hypothetical protein